VGSYGGCRGRWEAGDRPSAFAIVDHEGARWSLKRTARVPLDLVGERVNLEAVKSRYELLGGWFRPALGVHHEQHVREASAEICAIAVVVPVALWVVDVHAFWTVELHHRLSGNVAQADRKQRLAFTIYAWTIAEVTALVLFEHLGNASVGENVAGMNEPIKHFSGLLDQIVLIGVLVDVIVRLEIEDHVQRLALVWDLLIETG